MKKLGFILITIMLFTGANAQVQPNERLEDTTAAVTISNDSLVKLFMNGDLDAKEALLLNKLNPEQLLQLEKQRIEQEKFDDMPLPAWAIVLITTAPFLMVILIVFFSIKAKKEREKARYDLYLKSMEAGQPLPEKIFEEPVKKVSNLQRGAIWLAVGLGVVIFGLFENESSLMGLGAIPAFVGAAYLLVYFIEKRNSNDTPAVNE